jgi:hypothetical protein
MYCTTIINDTVSECAFFTEQTKTILIAFGAAAINRSKKIITSSFIIPQKKSKIMKGDTKIGINISFIKVRKAS